MDYSDYPDFLFGFKAHFKIVGYHNIVAPYCFIFKEAREIQSRTEEATIHLFFAIL